MNQNKDTEKEKEVKKEQKADVKTTDKSVIQLELMSKKIKEQDAKIADLEKKKEAEIANQELDNLIATYAANQKRIDELENNTFSNSKEEKSAEDKIAEDWVPDELKNIKKGGKKDE